MSMTALSLGLGRDVFKRAWVIESKKVPAQYKDVVGTVDHTTQLYEIYKQLAGLTYAAQTPDGEDVKFDDWTQLFSRAFEPVIFTKGIRYSRKFDYTTQRKDVLDKQPAFVRSFVHQKNRVASNMNNLGFTDTTYGMNGEPLYATNHSLGAGVTTGSNRPSTEVPFSPLGLEQGVVELRKQKSARGMPMPILGGLVLTVPPALELQAGRFVNANQLAGTNNNDPNQLKGLIRIARNDYYTSDTAWFLRSEDPAENGLFLLEQMPYEVEQLPRDKALMDTWVASESYTVGWMDWRGTWATLGA